MTMRVSTLVTPGADQAERSASCRSAQERTDPRRMTRLPSTSTVTLLASSWALRTKASSIFFFTSDGVTFGFTVIRLLMDFTPRMVRTARSAVSFW